MIKKLIIESDNTYISITIYTGTTNQYTWLRFGTNKPRMLKMVTIIYEQNASINMFNRTLSPLYKKNKYNNQSE